MSSQRSGPSHATPAAHPITQAQHAAPTASVVHREVSVQDASEADIDSHLRSLTKRTSIAELTRSGKTHNLKTMSERDLSDWIKEALRRVISTTTTIGDAEREQLLANTRMELNAIMLARQTERRDHSEDARALAVLTAERDELIARLAATETKAGGRVMVLQSQLAEAIDRRDNFAARIADREEQLARALAVPVADPAELSDLRGRLGERDAEMVTVSAKGDEYKRIAHEGIATIKRERERALNEKDGLTARIAVAERSNADLERRRSEAERRTLDAEDKLTAASIQATVVAERIKTAELRVDAQRAGSASKLENAETVRAGLTDELTQARGAAALVQDQLTAAVRAVAEARVAAEQLARQAHDDLIETTRESRRAADALLSAQADLLGAERSFDTVERARADIANERDQLAAALNAAETASGQEEARALTLEAERDAALRAATAASKRADGAEKRHSAALGENQHGDIAALRMALARARSVVTDAAGAPREEVTGPLVARKAGRWMGVWRDSKSRLKAARTVGDHWVGAGRISGIDPVIGVVGEPSLLARADGIVAAWHGIDGHAWIAHLDDSGRLTAPARDLGAAVGAPGLSRGGGEAPTFVVTTDTNGHVLLHEAGDAKPIDLTTALKAPPAAGPAAAWHWALEGSRHITYRDAIGGVHEFLELKGRWFYADIGARTGAPAAAADPLGYAPADHEHVVYLGVDGHIHEICFDAVDWRHHDLTAIAEAPAASGRPSGAYVAGRHCVVYRGVDGNAHCLRLRLDWRHIALTGLGSISSDPHLSSSGGEGAITHLNIHGQRRWARFTTDPATTNIADMPA